MTINFPLFAALAFAVVIAVMMFGFGYQMTFGNGQRLKKEDRRWWRFDWIWPPLSDSDRKL